MRRERITAHLCLQPPEKPRTKCIPPPTLRHRPSLRQPPRLVQQREDSGPENLPLALRKTRREAAVKGCRKAASLAGRGISASDSNNSTGSDAVELPIARKRHQREICATPTATKRRPKPLSMHLTRMSDSDDEGVDVGGGDASQPPQASEPSIVEYQPEHVPIGHGKERCSRHVENAKICSQMSSGVRATFGSHPEEQELGWVRQNQGANDETVTPGMYRDEYVDLRSVGSRSMEPCFRRSKASDQHHRYMEQERQEARSRSIIRPQRAISGVS